MSKILPARFRGADLRPGGLACHTRITREMCNRPKRKKDQQAIFRSLCAVKHFLTWNKA